MTPATPASVRDQQLAVTADLLQEDPEALPLLVARLSGSAVQDSLLAGLLATLRRHPAQALAVLESLRVGREWEPDGEAWARRPAAVLVHHVDERGVMQPLAYVYRLTDEVLWRVEVDGVEAGFCASPEDGRQLADQRLLEQGVALLGGAS